MQISLAIYWLLSKAAKCQEIQWMEGKTVSDLDSANSIAALSETAHTIYSPSCMRPAHQQPALESASAQTNKQTKH